VAGLHPDPLSGFRGWEEGKEKEEKGVGWKEQRRGGRKEKEGKGKRGERNGVEGRKGEVAATAISKSRRLRSSVNQAQLVSRQRSIT